MSSAREVREFLLRCKNSHQALLDLTSSVRRLRSRHAKMQQRVAERRRELQRVADEEKRMKVKFIRQGLELDQEEDDRRNLEERHLKLKREHAAMEKAAQHAEQEYSVAVLKFQKTYDRHVELKEEATKLHALLKKVNDERVQFHRDYLASMKQVEEYKQQLDHLKGQMNEMKAVVSDTLSEAKHIADSGAHNAASSSGAAGSASARPAAGGHRSSLGVGVGGGAAGGDRSYAFDTDFSDEDDDGGPAQGYY